MTGHPPDRLDALLRLAGAADEELTELRQVIAALRAAESTEDVRIDPEASWRRIEAALDDDLSDSRRADPSQD